MNRWLRDLHQSFSGLRRQACRSYRPTLEPLDDRTLPAVTLFGSATPAIATAATAFNGQVATFTDSDPSRQVGDFQTTIDWGDGHTSAGTLLDRGNGQFAVTGW